MVNICPECETEQQDDVKVCECGYVFVATNSHDPSRLRCGWTDGSNRCPMPGTLSHGIGSGAKFYCRNHIDVQSAEEGHQIMDDLLRNRHKIVPPRDWRDELVGEGVKRYGQQPDETRDEWIARIRAEFLALSRRGAFRRMAGSGEGVSRGEDSG